MYSMNRRKQNLYYYVSKFQSKGKFFCQTMVAFLENLNFNCFVIIYVKHILIHFKSEYLWYSYLDFTYSKATKKILQNFPVELMGIGKFEYSRLPMFIKHLVCSCRCKNDKNIKLNPNRDVHSSFSDLNKTIKQTYTFLKPSKTFDTVCTGNKSISS